MNTSDKAARQAKRVLRKAVAEKINMAHLTVSESICYIDLTEQD